MTRLSPHFRSEEFNCHDGTPVPEHHLNDLRSLCTRFLEPLRARYGPVRIISGYRTATYNAQVDGAPASFHIYREGRYGAAADIACKFGRPPHWYRYLDQLHPGGLGLYITHVHVDNRAGHARW